MNPRQRQPDLPKLEVLPVADLLLHEQHDAQRSAPLLGRLAEDGVLKNPPIVAPIPGETSYVVLDGANRVTAMRELGIPHVVAQVIDYEDPELELDTWHHLLRGMSGAALRALLAESAGLEVEPSELTHARALLARREILAFVQFPGGAVLALRAAGDLHSRTASLNALVDAYKSAGRIFRANTDHLGELLPLYEDIAALVVFPRFVPAEIIDLARVGACLPAGITRHLIPRRALRLNLPLEVLRSPEPLAQKNAWLGQWIREKMAHRSARYYQESTFLFDE